MPLSHASSPPLGAVFAHALTYLLPHLRLACRACPYQNRARAVDFPWPFQIWYSGPLSISWLVGSLERP